MLAPIVRITVDVLWWAAFIALAVALHHEHLRADMNAEHVAVLEDVRDRAKAELARTVSTCTDIAIERGACDVQLRQCWAGGSAIRGLHVGLEQPDADLLARCIEDRTAVVKLRRCRPTGVESWNCAPSVACEVRP